MRKIQAQAAQWRTEEGYTDKGGVGVIFNGEVQGWVDELRDPHHWVAGCIAIDTDGNEYIALLGTEYDGADRWMKMLDHNLQLELKRVQQEDVELSPGDACHNELLKRSLISKSTITDTSKELARIAIYFEVTEMGNQHLNMIESQQLN